MAAFNRSIPWSLFLFPLIWMTGFAGNGASRVNQVLVQLKEPKKGNSEEVFELTEEDLNAFIIAAIEGKKRLGLRKVVLALKSGGRIESTAVVNMDELELGGLAVQMFKTLLSGTQTLKQEGRFKVEKGKGIYTVESVSINEISVPTWLASSTLGYLGQRQPPYIDVTEPFDLPYGIQDIRITAGKIAIVR
ncbi:MAG: hypothetical protein ACE5JX_16550 [Acidobacteriota bacterium]